MLFSHCHVLPNLILTAAAGTILTASSICNLLWACLQAGALHGRAVREESSHDCLHFSHHTAGCFPGSPCTLAHSSPRTEG